MKNAILAAAMVIGLTGTAMAEDPVHADRSGMYVGGFLGSSTEDHSKMLVGVNAGYQFGKYFRAEVDVDRAWRTVGNNGYRAVVNGVAQYRIPNTVLTPYVLAGGGYAFDGLASLKSKTGQVAVWDAGIGTRIGISQKVDLDLRYTETRPVKDAKAAVKQDHVFTAGLDYRF